MDLNKERQLLLSVYITWIIFAVLMVIHHEMWRDELQAVMIVRESDSFSELFYNSRYEGHGPFWFVFLFVLGKISSSLVFIQIIHVLISAVTTWFILFRSPFTILTRILLIFGYFYFFEYTIIMRSYSVAALLMVLAAWSFTSKSKAAFYTRVVSLSLLATITIYGVILSFFLFVYSIWTEELQRRKLSLFIFYAVSLLLSLWKMYPPEDSGFAAGWFMEADLQKAVHSFEIIYESLIPLQKPGLHFWGTTVLDGSPALTGIKVVLSVTLMILSAYLIKERKLSILFLAGAFAVVLFTYIKFEGFVRHYGHIYLLLITCLWISWSTIKASVLQLRILQGLLVIHVFAAIIPVYYDLKYPFSGAREASDFLKAHSDDRDLLVADTDFIGTPVSAYLERSFYFPQSDRSGTYMIFDTKRDDLVSFDTVFVRSLRKADQGQRILFVLDYPVDTLENKIRLVYQGPQAIEKDEEYLIYSFQKP